MRRRIRRGIAAFFCVFGVAALGGAASAQQPPGPDFFWPYGRVSVGGGDLSPATQPVIAFVNGKACGFDTTFVAADGEGTPPGDSGRTVYVVDVLADGAGGGQRPGCGREGDPVQLWFPASGYIAQQHPTFRAGGLRVDLDVVPMQNRRTVPMLVTDGAP